MPEEPRRNRVTKPLEGTAKNPQGRLFNPVGQFAGDPWKLSVDNWMKQSDTPAHDDTIAWHGSEESQLPREDDYEYRAHEPGYGTGPDWGGSDEDYEEAADNDELDWEDENTYSEDSQGRPMGEYGSVVGMHFGTPNAASSRGGRPFMHPVRLPEATMADPPSGGFVTHLPNSQVAADNYRSHRDIVDSHTGDRTPDERWSDKAANYSEAATDLVEEGKTLAYRNDVEAAGSTSFRALPETARTWAEDVLSAKSPMTGRPASEKYGWADPQAFRNTPHPALVEAAEAGFNPVNERNKPGQRSSINSFAPDEPIQLSIPFDKSPTRMAVEAAYAKQGSTDPYGESGGYSDTKLTPERAAKIWEEHDIGEASEKRSQAFQAGKLWSLQQPKSIG